MCGIVGYVGSEQAAPILLDGLARLEYRGYDSAGIAVVSPRHELQVKKTVGRLKALSDLVHGGADVEGTIGMGHTRWATHGAPNDVNSHPHVSENGKFAVIHNGIIENYVELKEFLISQGVTFRSETDTEVVAQLLEFYCNECGDFFESVGRVLRRIEGAYALGMLCADCPDRIIAARKDAPLLLGFGEGCSFLASDATAIIKHTRDVVYMDDGEIAVLTRGGIQLYNAMQQPIEKEHHHIEWEVSAAEKGGYPHFMLKEIFEQPKVISDCLAGRVDEEKGMVVLPELDGLPVPSRLRIIACGTSYHAGMWGQHLLENWARMPVVPEIASEFRYRNVILEPDDMVLVISQSGETADTLAALRLAKEKGCIAIALCNVVGSSIPREADAVIYTQAGPEISVASTKAMCSQMVIMALIALYYGQRKGLLDAKTRHEALAALHGLPKQIEDALPAMRETAQMLSPLYASAHSFFYLGRGHAFPLALEGALKLKEISYIHAEGYASGEMKHGPIALIEPEFPTFALAFNDALFPKVKSNIVEVQARRGPVIALANPGADLHVEHLWTIPSAWGPFNAFLALPAMQLFSYEMADYLGKDVDQPRNLAKSVTVE